MRDPTPVEPSAPRRRTEPDTPGEPLAAAGNVALSGLDAFLTLIAALVLGCAGVFLTIAWTSGPQVWLRAAEYKKFTERADAAIVGSWVELALDTSRIRSSEFWRASAKASRCELVEYGASWGTPIRRVFCGPQTGFSDDYTIAELNDIAPGVPFAWTRDERGFALAEIRLDAAAHEWLAAHPAHTFMHDKWPAKSELDWLRIEYDRPVDLAIAGWSAKPATIAVAFDPKNPAGALPAGTVEARGAHSFNIVAVAVGGFLGLLLWRFGMTLLPWLRNFTPAGRWAIMLLPLLGLPWFAEQFPYALRALNVSIAEVIGDMFGDIDRLDAMTSRDAADVASSDGARLVWRAGDGVYADTFGRMHFAAPNKPYPSSDAALAALADTVTAEVAALDDASRAQLFSNLRRDKRLDLKAAGIVFTTAAKQAIVDPRTSAPVRSAAQRFVDEWLTQPVEPLDPHGLGYNERKRLTAEISATIAPAK